MNSSSVDATVDAGPLIVRLPALQRALAEFDPIPAIEIAFLAASEGNAVAPPGGELLFDDPAGDAHIKFGYLPNSSHFIVKVIAGYYDNACRGLPSLGGLVMLFDRRTGQPVAILLDDGWLTNLRTAAAGAVAARYLAPRRVRAIGVLGTGVQARMQVEHLQHVTPCRDLIAWGRNPENLARYAAEMTGKGYRVVAADNPGQVAAAANLIVTATPSATPLLLREQIRPGTHITAIGADTADKNELDPAILRAADIAAVDSRLLAGTRGESRRALEAGILAPSDLLELGEIVAEPTLGRRTDDQITVADLCGLAVQDIIIAEAALEALRRIGEPA
ncbi:MAG: ornithine cyclodeaminase family protein [Dongiaceae bacterium]